MSYNPNAPDKSAFAPPPEMNVVSIFMILCHIDLKFIIEKRFSSRRYRCQNAIN